MTRAIIPTSNGCNFDVVLEERNFAVTMESWTVIVLIPQALQLLTNSNARRSDTFNIHSLKWFSHSMNKSLIIPMFLLLWYSGSNYFPFFLLNARKRADVSINIVSKPSDQLATNKITPEFCLSPPYVRKLHNVQQFCRKTCNSWNQSHFIELVYTFAWRKQEAVRERCLHICTHIAIALFTMWPIWSKVLSLLKTCH